MQRRDFVSQIALGSVLGSMAGAQEVPQSSPSGSTVTPAHGASKLATTPMSLMAPRPDGVDAIWGVSELCKGKVEWKTTEGTTGIVDSNVFGMVPQGDQVIKVCINDLKPATKYQLRSISIDARGTRTEVGEWKSFQTLNPEAAETQFVVWNDTHVNNATIQQLHQKTPQADFLLWNGDTCNDWTQEEFLIPTLLNPGECDITNGRPLMFVWGNHDVRGKWAYKLPEMVATPSGRPFYAFRSGPVAAICLHTGEDKPDDHPSFGGRVAFDELRQEQTAWLEKTIAAPEYRDAPYRIVFCHIPLRWLTEKVPNYAEGGYDSFSYRNREAWHDLLVAWGTQIVISGHMHQHAWMPGTPEFPYGQLVGGGPAPKQATWIEAKADSTNLSLRMLKLDGSEVESVSLKPVA
jgi:hypothetical protein